MKFWYFFYVSRNKSKQLISCRSQAIKYSDFIKRQDIDLILI